MHLEKWLNFVIVEFKCVSTISNVNIFKSQRITDFDENKLVIIIIILIKIFHNFYNINKNFEAQLVINGWNIFADI